ncbi:MAG: glycosyltransferase family 4 protein [Chitinophagaceae bacterium]|nr:glycosyltransferase family 4 protein [Chitinophagaceae bacterium]
MLSPDKNVTGTLLRIAFDAKRAYQNGTGLGHYSRTLISSLATFYPEHEYYLCAPKLTNRFDSSAYTNVHDVTPKGLLVKTFKSLWRSNWVKTDLEKLSINIYHGLSHEIPLGIKATGIKTVVTIHDLIFERYPNQYKWIDVQIYRKKFTYACRNADLIIAISQQTKDDIIHFYKIPPEKIHICYQSCNPIFEQKVSLEEEQRVKNLYQLPEQYFLYVGSIIERKNLLNICKAYALLQDKLAIPLVVIGEGDHYKTEVVKFINGHGLSSKIIFLSDQPSAQSSMGFRQATDFPAIYQMATGMIYPSIFEGFGIPVLEALWSGTPVITSNISCMPETGGDAAFYIDPYSPEQIAHALMELSTNAALVETMIEKGYHHAQNFTPAKCAAAIMQIYLRL